MPTAISPISVKARSRLKLLSSPPQKSGRSQKPNSHKATMKITAAASRWVSHQRRPRALNSVGGETGAVRAGRLDRDRADVGRRRLGAAQPREQARDQLAPDDPGLDQHAPRAGSGRGRPARRPGGREAIACTCISWLPTLMRARDRHALAQHLVDQHDQDRTQARAEHPAAPAQDRGAADDHRGDHDQLGTLPVLRGDALVLGDVHQAGQRGAQRGQDEAADAHQPRVDAGILGRLLVAADGVGLVAPARPGEHDPADDGDEHERPGSGC